MPAHKEFARTIGAMHTASICDAVRVALFETYQDYVIRNDLTSAELQLLSAYRQGVERKVRGAYGGGE